MSQPVNFDPYGLRQVLSDKVDFDNWMRDNGGNFKEARNLAFAAWQASRRLYAKPAIGIPISALGQCWCTTCRPITLEDARFVVCPDCGNKRCPRANNHELACTNSNAPGQAGSSWEHVKPLG